MSHHPSGAHRAHHHEKHRVHALYGVSHTGSATIANRLTPSDRSMEKKAYKTRDALAVEGGVPKERYDRPGRSLRASGGRVPHRAEGGRVHKGKGKGTTVNVIIAGSSGGGGPGLGAPPPRPMPAAPPPMAGPPGGAAGAMPPPGGAPGMPPRPGMPPQGMPPGMPMRAKGGRIPKGTKVWREGVADGTQVQNNPAGKNDQHDVDRGKPITYNTGGRVRRATGGSVHFFGNADMGIPHPFKGKDFSHPMTQPSDKKVMKGRNDPPGEGKMPSNKAVMGGGHEAKGRGHAGKGDFAPGTMKEPKPQSGPSEHSKGVAGLGVKGGGGGARARLAKIKKYGP